MPAAARRPVDAVRAVYDRWAAGDFRASMDVFDPLVLLVMRPEFPDAGTYLGVEQVAAYTRSLLEPWSEFAIRAEELIEAGDSVVVAVHQRGVGTTSGAVSELRYLMVWTFRGDRAVRLESVRDRDDALALVGLR